jgi:small subunit ribosomal protein S18
MDNENKEKKHEISHIDYKDITKLGAQINPHARILSRKRTGLKASAQRDLAKSIKRARFMALLPYVSH